MSLNKEKICVRCGKDKGCKEDCCVYGVCYGKHDFNVPSKEKCEYCESGVNHDPISMFCHLRDEHKQDTTDWATEFDEKYSIFPIGYYSEELVPNSGEKEPIKDFIQSVRQKAYREAEIKYSTQTGGMVSQGWHKNMLLKAQQEGYREGTRDEHTRIWNNVLGHFFAKDRNHIKYQDLIDLSNQ